MTPWSAIIEFQESLSQYERQCDILHTGWTVTAVDGDA